MFLVARWGLSRQAIHLRFSKEISVVQIMSVFKTFPFASFVLFLCIGCACGLPAFAAEPYKIYIVNKYGAWDIVCDRYAVKEGDHIWEILRRKGRMAEENFPQFVEILKDMNPHIKDVDKIYPGQNIVIPLKQIPPRDRETHEEAGPRYVTIPMIPDVLFDYHRVVSGDYVSQIVTRYLDVPWNEIPDKYFKTFSRLNPQIEDLDLIYPGQLVRIPELMPDKAPVAPSVKAPEPEAMGEEIAKVDEADPPAVETLSPEVSVLAGEPSSDEVSETKKDLPSIEVAGETDMEERGRRVAGIDGPGERMGKPKWDGLVSAVAREVGGRLLSSGYCYFPGKDGKDVPLDLRKFPVIELGDGRHVLFESGVPLPRELEKTIKASWKGMVVLEASRVASGETVLEQVFSEVFGDQVRQSIAVPELDDGVQVVLGGDWVIPVHRGKEGEPAYYAITLMENSGEKTFGSVVAYLADADIRIVDIPKRSSRASGGRLTKEQKADGFSHITLETSGPEAFISALTDAMGYYYEPQIPLTFDYAGFQVETTVNVVHGKGGMDVVVDFGTFYGDAVSSIEKGGLKVLSVEAGDGYLAMAIDLLEALQCSHTKSPELFAADRELDRASSLIVPGVLVSPAGGNRGLLTETELAPELIRFLGEKGIGVWQIGHSPSGEGQ